jgi:hypothetical protein
LRTLRPTHAMLEELCCHHWAGSEIPCNVRRCQGARTRYTLNQMKQRLPRILSLVKIEHFLIFKMPIMQVESW